jgi:hypothetical protein
MGRYEPSPNKCCPVDISNGEKTVKNCRFKKFRRTYSKYYTRME